LLATKVILSPTTTFASAPNHAINVLASCHTQYDPSLTEHANSLLESVVEFQQQTQIIPKRRFALVTNAQELVALETTFFFALISVAGKLDNNRRRWLVSKSQSFEIVKQTIAAF
jgi:hypothetical protein